MHNEETRLTRAQIKDVVERAAKMTELDDTVSVADLRKIAEELDLDPLALEAALEQVLAESGRIGTDRLLSIPDAARLREIRPGVLTAFVAAAAWITPGDIVPVTALLAAAMATLYEALIALISVTQARRAGGPPRTPPRSALDKPASGRERLDSPEDPIDGLRRIRASVLSIEDGVRVFQAAVRGT